MSSGWWAAFALVLVAAAVPRAVFLARTLPYALHEDETYIARPAVDMVLEGHLHPHFFQYPSLPIYLTAGAFVAGTGLEAFASDGERSKGGDGELADGSSESNSRGERSNDRSERERDVRDRGGAVGESAGDLRQLRPYYGRPVAVGTARVLFALLSIAAMGFAGVAGWRAFGSPALLVLVPLGLLVSERFLVQSWVYLNVDVVGACVCTAALAWLFATWERDGFVERVVVPGLIVGCAAGSKYYLGLVGLPFALRLVQGGRGAGGRVLALAGFTVLGFVCTTPYALLDYATFEREVAFELAHYGGGHRGEAFDGEPGLPQLLYYLGEIHGEFGTALIALAGVGTVAAFARSPRRALAFLAFPIALLAFLCTQRVHFPRNLTSLYALLPVLSALGGVELASLLARQWERWAAPRMARSAAVVLVLAAVAAALPWQRIARTYAVPVDSRTLTVRWIAEHAQVERAVLVAAELGIDLRPLGGRVRVLPFAELVGEGMAARYRAQDPLFVLPKLVPGTPDAREHAALVAPIAELEERASFGANGLARHPQRPIHMGNPRLSIHELPRADASQR